MATVYTFPPVGIASVLLSEDRPVRRSQYTLSGKRAVASAGAARRTLEIAVSHLAKDRAGAGYMAQLWRYLDGGVNLVRMTLPPQNWHLDQSDLRAAFGNVALHWTNEASPLAWTDGGAPLVWFTNTVRTAANIGTTQYPALVSVTGLPANTIVARPGDIVRVFGSGDDQGTTAQVMDICRTDASGGVSVPLSSAVPDGVISFADEESAIFEVMEYGPGAQSPGRNWQITVRLREVFASELNTITEVEAWRA